jgi:hypothetical protein
MERFIKIPQAILRLKIGEINPFLGLIKTPTRLIMNGLRDRDKIGRHQVHIAIRLDQFKSA